MTIEAAVVMFVLFMINTWFCHRQGYQKGAAGGHFVGVHDTIEYMMEKAHLGGTVNIEDGGRPATLDEMTIYVTKELIDRRIKRMERAAQE